MTLRGIIQQRRESILLAFMLESLHVSLWLNITSPLSRSLMLVHLGLFLMWQPVWRGDRKLSWYNGVLFIALTLGLVTWMNWVVVTGWLILLTGYFSGRIATNRRERTVNLLLLAFLVSELLIRCTSELFNVEVPYSITGFFGVFLPCLPVFIALIPRQPRDLVLNAVDILHAIAGSTLVSLLMAGSLLNMYRSNIDYMGALLQSLIAISIFLFGISWLLTPRPGFSGLSQLWLRSILNIGTPFERWLTELSHLARVEESPEDFLSAAMEELVALPWVEAVEWQSPHSTGEYGRKEGPRTEFKIDRLVVYIYSFGPVGGALYIHCKLLVHLINHFYVAKVQERELTKRAQLQAVYETGARVTHDIKNLLQSLSAITSIIVNEPESESESVTQKLLRRQLPHLMQRLQLALDKLQTPAGPSQDQVYLKDWWQDLKIRTHQPGLTFQADIRGDPLIPPELFDSVVENLLENLREKMHMEPGIEATATLIGTEDHFQLSVCDNGRRIPEDIARHILKEPLNSSSGLGIGLFQAARQAEAAGYTLELETNRDGRVCFQLQSAK